MTGLLLLVLACWALALVHGLVFWSWREALRRSASEVVPLHVKEIDLSVIIPVRNEADGIVALLQDLHGQTHPHANTQVIVVDDGSTDATREKVEDLQARWSELTLLRSPGEGKKAAIGHGVAHARGELLVMTDGDVRCGPDRLRTIAGAWQVQGVDMLLLPVLTDKRWTALLAWLEEAEQAVLQGATLGAGLQGQALLANGANFAVSRKAFLDALGMRTDARWSSGDDLFLLRAVARQGGRIGALAGPEAAVVVEGNTRWREFLSQRLRWAGKMRALPFAPATWVASIALLWPWLAAALSGYLLQHPPVGQGLVRIVLLMTTAWCIWALPIIALACAWQRRVHRPCSSFRMLLLLPLGMLLSTCIAVVSIFVRPKWKGRRTRGR
ncbi:MAG: glycosyltransferase [Flavobacteriales bacterium]|nr:glycosyltransferase [Flavobacteriales bacterium]